MPTATTSGSYTAVAAQQTATASGSYTSTAASTVRTATASGSYVSERGDYGTGWSLWHYLGDGKTVQVDIYHWDGDTLLRLSTLSPPITPGPSIA